MPDATGHTVREPDPAQCRVDPGAPQLVVLATALAQLSEPEEASQTALQALTIFSERPVDSVMRRAGDLEAVLDMEPYRRLPAVRRFRERLEITRALRPNGEN